jgi:ribose transport system permease protein
LWSPSGCWRWPAAALGITQGQTISGFPQGFLAIGQGTTFGRHVYLLGSNEQAALLSGIAVRRTKILIFTVASTLAACAAIVETARLTVGQPSAGAGYELAAIGAVVIGGACSAAGDRSSAQCWAPRCWA